MEKVIKRSKNYQAILFPIFDVLLNGGNLLIHLYISWYLNTNAYGILNALFSLLFVLMIFGMSIQTYFAKRISAQDFQPEEEIRIRNVSIQLTVFISILMITLTPLMIKLLRASVISYFIIITIFAYQLNLSYYRGYLQGKKMFLKLNLSFYLEMFVKLLVLIPVLRNYQNLEVALISVLAGIVVSYFSTSRKARHNDKRFESRRIFKDVFKIDRYMIQIYNDFFQVFSTQFFFYYFTAVVLILCNFYLQDQAGVYALSTRYGQIFIHIGLSVITVFIPYTSETTSNFKKFKKKVLKILGFYMITGFILLIGYSVIMPIALKLLFDQSYHGAGLVIIPQAVAYYFLSIAFFMASMEMVYGSKAYIAILGIFSVILMVALMYWHNTIIEVVHIEISVYTSMAIVLVLRFLLRRE